MRYQNETLYTYSLGTWLYKTVKYVTFKLYFLMLYIAKVAPKRIFRFAQRLRVNSAKFNQLVGLILY